MKYLVIICLLILCSSCVTAQDARPNSLGQLKQWEIHTRHGDVNIRLRIPPNGGNNRSVLSLLPQGGAVPTVSEDADMLRQVMRNMSELGYDPHKLDMITTWLQHTEFEGGVERAVFGSRRWKSCLGLKYCHKEEAVADHFLASVNAFKEFDTVLREYGLTRKEVRIDDMVVGAKGGRVLCSGVIIISLDTEK